MTTRVQLSIITFILLATQPAVRADVVTDWNSAALGAIRLDKTPPPKASRALAILHAAIYDAVNGITRTHERYLIGGNAPASASVEAAAAAAAHRVLVSLYPAQQATFDAAYQASLASVADGPRKNAGVAWGESVATQLLAVRASDGFDATVPPPSGSGPGAWVPTPPAFAPYLLPQWAFLRPFCMTTSSEFRPPGPPALTSARYAADVNEVKQLGAATNSTRTAEQSMIALFWADAAVCAWDAKYAFNFWRPVTAIRNADTDGNADTEPDTAWRSFIATPPFPDYVSGHSTFSGAASVVLAPFYGSDNIAFTTGSDALPGVERSFTSFSAAAAEAADSRLYGGIHFRSANEDGLHAGIAIGHVAAENFLLPKVNHSRIK